MSLANRNSLAPWMPDSIDYYPHQVEGIRKMAEMRSVLLADEMGLGKTLQALTVFAIDVKRRNTDPQGAALYGDTLLIVCPASLKLNWLEEVQQFTTFHVEVLRNGWTKARRIKQLAEFAAVTGPKILIVNYEQLVAHLEDLDLMRFHMIAFDEAHRMKNLRSKTGAACQKITSTRSVCITGSPLLNKVDELFPLLDRITPGQWGSYYKFVQRYAVFGGYEGKQIIGTKNEKELNTRLGAVMIRRLKKDVLGLPEVQYIDRLVDLHPRQKTLYSQVQEELRLELSASESVEVKNPLTKFLRLKQICGTTATVIPGEDKSDKLDVAADDARELLDSGHRVIAFTQFRGVLEAYQKRMEFTTPLQRQGYPVYVLHGDVPMDERQGVVHAWANNPRPGIIIAMYQVAGVGLNMTAASHGQLLDKLFVPALNQQAVDRMHRIGASMTQPVQVFQYLCKGTVEDRVEKILKQKKTIFENVVEESALTSLLMKEILAEESEMATT